MIDIANFDHYDVIHSEADPEFEALELFLIQAEGNVFAGYGTGFNVDKVIDVEDFSNTCESSDYSGILQTYCAVCQEFDANQLSGSYGKPSLDACHNCHDHVRVQLAGIIEEYFPEVIAGSL